MKKYLVFAAAAISAVVSQAASVEWSSGDLSDAVQAQSDITGVTAYYYVIDQTEYNALASLSQEDIYNRYFAEDGAKYGTAATHSEVASAPFYYSSYDQTIADPSSLTPANTAYLVAIYVAESAFGGSYALASRASATFDPDNQFGDAVSGNFDDIAVDAFAAASNAWAPVPEPTTVALLALGLAAVGLKRKVA